MFRGLKYGNTDPANSYSFSLNQFLGVDFTKGDYVSDSRRSPDALNTIWNTNPNVFDTRTGIKRIIGANEDYPRLVDDSGNAVPIYGIFPYSSTELLFHAGTSIYTLTISDITTDTNTYTELYTGVNATKSTSFIMNGVMYIMGCGKYLQYDGSIIEVVNDNVTTFIPTTSIAKAPTGGGTAFESVNLLNKWRKNSFLPANNGTYTYETFNGDTTTTEFVLTGSDIDFSNITIEVDSVTVTAFTTDKDTSTITFVTAPSTGTDNIVIGYYKWQTVYQLDTTHIDYAPITVTVDGVELDLTTDYTVDRELGEITFVTAPQVNVGGVDNVIITFAKTNNDLVEVTDSFLVDDTLATEYILTEENITYTPFVVKKNSLTLTLTTDYTEDRINHKIVLVDTPTENDIIEVTYNAYENGSIIDNCSIFGMFGGANDTRVFVSGNSDYKNRDWQSGLYDPTYFPDTGYTDIGNDNIAIMGYVKQYDTQMIIKEGNQQDGSAFLRTFALDSDNVAYFPIEQGAVGIGAISSHSFAYLQGEPLFLSGQGVVGVSGTNVDYHRLIQDKSELINSRLTHETNLKDALGIEFNNKYYLFINGVVYVCDYRMRYEDDFGNAQYEWSYWNGIYADSVAVVGTSLVIGYNGVLFRLKETTDLSAYIDETIEGEEVTIDSYWTTPKLFFKSITKKKRMKNLFVLFSKHKRSNVNVTAIVDNERTIDLGTFVRNGVLNFTDINFKSFTFAANSLTFAYKERAMIENFDNIQFKLKKITDSTINTSFGVELLQATYQFSGN